MRTRRSGNYKANAARIFAERRAGLDRGLTKASFILERETMPRTPVDTGNLRSSRFHEDRESSNKLRRIFGFTAKYAAWVHEMVSQKLKGQPRAHFGATGAGEEFGGGSGKGTYWDSGEPRFLANAFAAVNARMRDVIRKEAGK